MSEKIWDQREDAYAAGLGDNSRPLARISRDVRHLCVCDGCDKWADDRDTVDGTWHPKCFYEARGGDEVVQLRDEDRGKFRLCDIPHDLMRRLLK